MPRSIHWALVLSHAAALCEAPAISPPSAPRAAAPDHRRIARAAIEEAMSVERQVSKQAGGAGIGQIAEGRAWFDLEVAFKMAEPARGNSLTDFRVNELASALTRRDAPPEVRSGLGEWIARLADYASAPEDEWTRVRALGALARHVARVDPSAARRLWDEAVQAAEGIKDRQSQSYALSGLAEDMARADSRRAVALAERIFFEQPREYTLQMIAARLAVTDLPAALAGARRLPRRSLQVQALCAVADKVAARDRKRADQILNAAYERALTLEDRSVLPELFTTLAASWADVNPRRALGVLPKNDERAHWIAQLEWVALFSHSVVAFAPTDVKQSLALARRVPPYQWSGEYTRHLGRAQTLSEIAARIRQRDPRQARTLLEEALVIAQKAGPPEYRSELLSTVLSASDPDYRAEALLLTAAALRRESPDRSRALYREGVDCLQEMSHPERRDYWLERLVRVWAQVDPIEAEALARWVADPRHRDMVLFLACREMWRQDVDRAVQLARSLPPNAAVASRDRALAAVTAGVAKADPDRALGIARSIQDRYRREEAFEAIIAALAHRNTSRAVALVPLLRDEEEKVFSLLKLAQEKEQTAVHRRQWLSLAAATARRLSMPAYRVEWLTRIASDGAASEPAVAKRLLRDAYSRAMEQRKAEDRATGLGEVAVAAVNREPGWAMQIATRIPDERKHGRVRGLIAGPLARHDATRALRWAIQCPSLPDRCAAFVGIAEALETAPKS